VSKKNRNPQPQPQTQTVTVERPAHIDDGTETRGNVNSRVNQTRTQPEPNPGTAAIGEEAAGKVVALRPAKGGRANIFEQHHKETVEAVANKSQQLSEARQRLAEAADLYGEGTAKEAEANEAAAKAALLLTTARTAGTITADELSGILGDQFGFKLKQDKTPSKTPDGRGEAIRKRIVRLVQGFQHINGGDGGRFFETIPEDATDDNGRTVSDIVEGALKGDIGFWASYEALAEIKKNSATRLDAAYDPKRIAALAEKLQEEGAASKFVNNRALVDAYTALRDMINIIGEEVAQLAANKAA
jgi:hypothetical protein